MDGKITGTFFIEDISTLFNNLKCSTVKAKMCYSKFTKLCSLSMSVVSLSRMCIKPK